MTEQREVAEERFYSPHPKPYPHLAQGFKAPYCIFKDWLKLIRNQVKILIDLCAQQLKIYFLTNF